MKTGVNQFQINQSTSYGILPIKEFTRGDMHTYTHKISVGGHKMPICLKFFSTLMITALTVLKMVSSSWYRAVGIIGKLKNIIERKIARPKTRTNPSKQVIKTIWVQEINDDLYK